MTAFLEGERCRPEKLTSQLAQQLAKALLASSIGYASLVEIRRAGEREIILIDLQLSVPQQVPHDIRPSERIAVVFSSAQAGPLVYVLREDFPDLPHQNLAPPGEPRSLCLYEQGFEEVRLSWTPARFVRTIRSWLERSAVGELHEWDQPLEPFLLADVGYILLPSRLDAMAEEGIFQSSLAGRKLPDGRFFLWLKGSRQVLDHQELFSVALSFHHLSPQTHGVIRSTPRSLGELCELLRPCGYDLLGELREGLKQADFDRSGYGKQVVLVLRVPLRRDGHSDTEEESLHAFFLDRTIEQLGCDLNLWSSIDKGPLGLLVGQELPDPESLDARMDPLRVVQELSQGTACEFNQTPAVLERTKLVAIGLGALGSHVVDHAARAGLGQWFLIDDDVLLPHNTARHSLGAYAVGFSKSLASAIFSNSLTSDQVRFRHATENIFRPEHSWPEVCGADRVVDMSASVAVSRHLGAQDAVGPSMSVFLSPKGGDLVILAEDQERSTRLTVLEAQYYRLVATTNALEGHLDGANDGLRYSTACRHVSSRIPCHTVTLLASIAYQQLVRTLQDRESTVAVWRTGADGTVHRYTAPVQAARVCHNGRWKVVIDAGLEQALTVLRTEGLPKETGGILVGFFHTLNQEIYLVDALPPPEDSQCASTSFIRGTAALKSSLEAYASRCGGMVEYVGEWHSHPQGVSAQPSRDDQILLSWISERMLTEGLPAVMLIVAEGEVRVEVRDEQGE